MKSLEKRDANGRFVKGVKKSSNWYKAIKKRKPWNKGRAGYKTKPASEERKLKISLAQKGKPKWTEEEKIRYFRGKNASNWKGGISRTYKTGYYTESYKQWRKSVFERDSYTCQICRKVGGYLTAHHIKSFAYYPKLRFEINNGVTLCEDCHKLTDNYAGRGRKK